MIKSMTAYGRFEYESAERMFVAEIKTVNNRYRDIVLRIPRSLQVLEDEIRSQITGRVQRGRVEVSIQMKKNGSETEYRLELNRPLVQSYLELFKDLKTEFGLDPKVSTDYLCQMKDVILFRPEEVDKTAIKEDIQVVLEKALDSLEEMRLKEGSAIKDDFMARLELVENYLGEIEEKVPGVVESYRERLQERLNRIAGDLEIDETRLLQEVALFADKCDITEEIVRGKSHLVQFRHYLGTDEAVGRRLDFLAQEIFREINTLGAKANDSFVSGKVIEIKAELEKLREQIQNVE